MNDPNAVGSPGPAALTQQQALERLRDYLSKLCSSFSARDPQVKVAYRFMDFGGLDGLVQTAYRVEELPAGGTGAFALRFDCVGRHPARLWTKDAEEREFYRRYLAEHGVRGNDESWDMHRFGFMVEPRVPVGFAFLPRADGTIGLQAVNYHGLGSTRYSLQPQAVDATLLEELRKLLLRQDNCFARLAGFTVSAEARARLREKIAERRIERSNEVQQGGPAQGSGSAFRGLLRRKREEQPERDAQLGGHAPSMRRAPDLGGNAEVDPRGRSGAGTADAPETPGRPARIASYAWYLMVPGEVVQTADAVGKLGPRDRKPGTRVASIIARGERFQLLDAAGEARFVGHIVGEYRGAEPLVDFGFAEGCTRIQYQRGGCWVEIEVSPRLASGLLGVSLTEEL